MKVIIMAAGKGSRISRHIGEKPKCTLEIKDNLPLIENTVKNLNNKGIYDITIILGYNGKEIEKVLKGYKVKFYYNYFYDVTNSIASLWFAKKELETDKDIMFMNGDVFFEEHFLDEIKKEELSPVLYADGSRKEEADYKLFYENGILYKYGKELKLNETTGEYIGVAKILNKDINIIKNKLDNMIKDGKHSLWWENVLYELNSNMKIYVKEIKNIFWAEVDYIEDYMRIKEFIDSENR
ncbi:phosphocholine cytidylyltransferase family protein [Haliovirga abyssi]|uniref:Nucleotidyltransferase n=1 Tax=Haliovirga abyssi TaxID=2996794 RepID=A0AAU9DEE1_9FUSO|nr:phosphocholine cytidylyltransferase family protein [Haliovirga abyssi]BDU49687.1 nucleotidyltransferase [Haliovirga abyssi]